MTKYFVESTIFFLQCTNPDQQDVLDRFIPRYIIDNLILFVQGL